MTVAESENIQDVMAARAVEYCSAGHWGQAVLPLLQACMEPAQWAYHALLARALNQLGRNDLAVNFLQYGLRRQPDHVSLRTIYWQAAAKAVPMVRLQQEARVFMPEATEPTELKLLSAILGAAPSIEAGSSLLTAGVPESETVLGSDPQAPDPTAPVDILIPVFGGYQHTRRCLESLIQARTHNQTPGTLIVLDDAGQDQTLSAYLKQLAQAGQIQLHRHAKNLGFIENINYGMRLYPTHDVVWVNSDTAVHGNWLDRLRQAAYSQPQVASVTPLSNNGELLSLTAKQIASAMPNAEALARIDTTVAQSNLPAINIAAGCGFCFYIPRAAINVIGYLNNIDLKRGYGEETEWSMRARQQGWVHLAAVNTYVAHEGGNSFGLEKTLRVFQNNGWIRQNYPDIDDLFKNHPGNPALDEARKQIQLARLPELQAWAADKKPELEVVPEFLAGHFPFVQKSTHSKPAIRLSYEPNGNDGDVTVMLQAPLSPEWRLSLKLPAETSVFQNCLEQLVPDLVRLSIDEGGSALPLSLHRLLETIPPGRLMQTEQPKATPLKSLTYKQLLGKTWLIADRLANPNTSAAWIALAQQIGQNNREQGAAPTIFCFLEPGSHAHPLRASGAAYQLPRLEGLPILELTKLANIQGAITLGAAESESEAASPYPRALANRCKQMLYALRPD